MYSYKILKTQYDYLLPIFGLALNNPKLLTKPSKYKIEDDYYFIGTYEDYLDMLNRCKYLKS